MEETTIKLMNLLDTDTDIDWWNKNRERINEVIREFNDWQIVHRFDEFEKRVVKAKIDLSREYGRSGMHEFSDWQFELLDEMDEFIESI